MSSNQGYFEDPTNPVTVLQYQDMSDVQIVVSSHKAAGSKPVRRESRAAQIPEQDSEVDLDAILAQERAVAARETEERLSQAFEQKLVATKAPIATAIAEFTEQRNDYFARLEAEVVQLALAIAKKILHREAHVDPMLVAALVRIAIDNLREGSAVTIRVNPGKVANWKAYIAGQGAASRAEVVADAGLSDLDCMLETELGTANFGLDTQLKEVEKGFFDLLALRPVTR